MLEIRPDWENQEHECPYCGWRGEGSALIQRPLTTDFVDVQCPECEQSIALTLAPEALTEVHERNLRRKGA